jgi:serine/threonine-protein kinase
VVNTSPDNGSTVQPNSTVTLHLSSHNMGKVPDLSGQTANEARATLANNGFTAKPKVVPVTATDPAQVGQVTGQDPSAGSVKKFDTVVKIFVGTAAQGPASPTPAPASSAPPSSPPPGG